MAENRTYFWSFLELESHKFGLKHGINLKVSLHLQFLQYSDTVRCNTTKYQ